MSYRKAEAVNCVKHPSPLCFADVVTPVLPDVPEELADLNDVSDTVPADGQVLKWDGTEWAPADDEMRDLSNYLQKPGSEGDIYY